eukprot:4286581-Pleurochrysis_carterae.AAC.1
MLLSRLTRRSTGALIPVSPAYRSFLLASIDGRPQPRLARVEEGAHAPLASRCAYDHLRRLEGDCFGLPLDLRTPEEGRVAAD